MIQVSDTFDITTGTAPYFYTWSFNKPCVEVSQITGSTPGTFSTTFTLEENCFPFIATLTITDALGCNSTLTYTYTSPCSNFTVSEITLSRDTYVVTATNVVEPVIYEWTYNTELYNATINNNSIILQRKAGVPRQETNTVSVEITDGRGCKKIVTNTFTFEEQVIVVVPTDVIAFCNTGNARGNTIIRVTAPVPLLLTVTGIQDANIPVRFWGYTGFNNRLDLILLNSLGFTGSTTISLRLTFSDGSVSSPFNFIVVLPNCDELGGGPDIITIE